MPPDLPRNFDNKVTDVSQLNFEAVESEMIVCYTCTINNEEAAEGNVDETKENGNTEQDEQCVDIVECKKRLREAYETILMYEVPLDDLERKLHRRIRMRLTDSRALLNNSKEQTDQSYFTRYKMYKVPINHESSEDGFNQLFVWPFLDLIGSNTNVEDCQGYFMRGEPFLESMSRQLRATGISVDEKSQYKSDGLIKLFGLKKNRSLCCLKLQAILGTLIAQKSSWIITRGYNKLHLWSVRYQADGLFDLWRESCLEIRPNFEDRVEFLSQIIKFCWNTKRLLEQAVNHLIDVKKEHQGNISKYRYNPEQFTQLSSIVNPVIMKLTKEEDGAGMGNLGPIYSPPHY
ncbi:hypothetical protein RO3G_13387 [Rhizopus delemar RA 99-880]|uniref:Uncharacterized protein n=1 Tax=Rhizopus delemar (strain RA 99-880 / ATCC MYA-4621 / FGSC 9543 / NRRL 43880) TaxID=246409 RepID=I1CJP6_RHIO9|nr:hypothetical protein RO3G_13387 [Rhizopus delemar RA 99-880]|eukprot:EIE88676.1 hypothetical protein RO3G_13387 [Rhizopus delemar RA 99-880]